MKTALSIAGSDPSGGAGIAADIKTMTVNGVYAMCAVTALTAQNTLGVAAVSEVSPQFLKQQLNSVFEDIFPDAVKIGMVFSAPLINVIAERLRFYNAKNIVADPVMAATSGASLMKSDAMSVLVNKLFPIAALITPNIPEAEALSQMPICGEKDMIKVSKLLGKTYGCSVLVKGGHSISDSNDILYTKGEHIRFEGRHIDNPNTHGTGCTLSSAIAANLAKGFSLEDSVRRSKEYISAALESGLDLGKGSGPINHAFVCDGYFSEEDSGR